MGDLQKVVLAGATGNVGAPLLQALLDANFEVTVLTRPESNHTFPPSVKVEKVDYDNVEALTSIFRGQDAFISTVGAGGIKQQKGMVDAVVAANVKRLIPSEFGSDITNPKVAGFPLFEQKQELQQYIKSATAGSQTSWTSINSGPFLDFCTDHKVWIDIPNKRIRLFDGGDVPFTTTPIPVVAKGVVAVLQQPDETKNRAVQMKGANVTQNQLLRLAQKYTGEEGWQVEEVDTEVLEKEAWRKVREDPKNLTMAVFVDFLARAIVGPGYGGNIGEFHDNRMLGIKQMTEDEVDEFIKQRATA